MRLWTLHPCLLDYKGLGALWRETLLARSVLNNPDKPHGKHPQLIRFRQHADPDSAINYYLYQIWAESKMRLYSYNADKLCPVNNADKLIRSIDVFSGQVDFEIDHLEIKLLNRDPEWFRKIDRKYDLNFPPLNPLFRYVINRSVNSWERWKR